MSRAFSPMHVPALVLVAASAVALALPAEAQQEQAFRNKTRSELSHDLMKCVVAYELTNQTNKIPPLSDAVSRYNNRSQEFYTKFHASAQTALAADKDFTSGLSIEASVCDTLAPEQIDLGDAMRLDAWHEGDAFK